MQEPLALALMRGSTRVYDASLPAARLASNCSMGRMFLRHDGGGMWACMGCAVRVSACKRARVRVYVHVREHVREGGG